MTSTRYLDPQLDFVHEPLPVRVVFGAGRFSGISEEVSRLGLRRLLVVCTPGKQVLGESAARLLGDRAAGICAAAQMHVQTDTAEAAVTQARSLSVDGCVAIGGGSAIGLAKAIAVQTELPFVCVPTTYSGSEMTSIWALTENGEKRTSRSPLALARTVIYDPSLTTNLPSTFAVASGMNALAHAVEALYAPESSPIIALLAEESARSLAVALPALRDTTVSNARALAFRGSWLAGMCLGATTMSLHHKICHVLGGRFGLPHAVTHAVVLPHVASFNLPASRDAEAALRRALSSNHPGTALHVLASAAGITDTLQSLGLSKQDIATAADDVVAQPYHNPRPVDRDAVLAILSAAWHGGPPERQSDH